MKSIIESGVAISLLMEHADLLSRREIRLLQGLVDLCVSLKQDNNYYVLNAIDYLKLYGDVSKADLAKDRK